MDTVIAICLGIGLSAACGFRVFVPMLAAGVAARAGILTLGDDFTWIASTPALAAFGIATLLEIGGYYIPWLDNLFDTISSPAAVIAGTIATAAFLSKTEMSPLLLWSIAIIAGGGSAGIVKGGTTTVRAASTATTGGSTNFVVSTLELIASFVMSVLAIFVPILAAILVIVLFIVAMRFIIRRFRKPASPITNEVKRSTQ